MSPSSRRAWIEITPAVAEKARRGVALLAEGVDRNAFQRQNLKTDFRVALLAEGVDRNAGLGVVLDAVRCVALLAEGVDRNC